MSATYHVYARDVDFRRLGEVDDYDEMKAVLRFNDVGTWHLTGSASSKAATLLTETGGIIITRDAGAGPVTIFSGPVTDLVVDAEAIELAGVSDEVLLAESVALPDPTAVPAANGSVTYATENDVRSGTASTVMLAYVSANIGPAAVAQNRETALVLGTDLGRGSVVYGRPRFTPMLLLQQELALKGGGLRFQVLQSDVTTGQLVFSVSEPVDRRNAVIVSRARGTLASWKRTVSRPTATRKLVLGQGQGVNRSVIQGEDTLASSKYGRPIVSVDDRRDTNDLAELQQDLAVGLSDGAEQQSVVFTPTDTVNVVWGRDYDLGDLVSVVAGGVQLDEVVREVDLTLSASGSEPIVQPIISTPGDSADDPASRQLGAVHKRVSNLERNVDALVTALTVQWNVGNLRATLTATAAPGWLLCQGQAVSRSTYFQLFGVIGTVFGAGDGSTTFNLPDFRDRVPIGAGLTYEVGQLAGSSTINVGHVHDLNSHLHGLGSHTHTLAHTHDLANHSHTLGGHTHQLSSHTHDLALHTHDLALHTHTGPSHTHDLANHTHPGPSHTHDLANHTHPVSGTASSSGTSTSNQIGAASSGTTGAVNSVTYDPHHHTFDVSASFSVTSGTPSNNTSGSAGTGATGTPSNNTSSAAGTGATGTPSTNTSGTPSVNTSSSPSNNTSGGPSVGSDGPSTNASGAASTALTSTAVGNTDAAVGNTGSGGSSSLSIVPLSIACNWEIYAAA